MSALRRRRATAALGIVFVLVAGCQAATVSPSPGVSAAPTSSPATPTQQASTAPTSPSSSPTAAPPSLAPSAAPVPSATSAVVSPAPGGAWVPAGKMAADYFSGLAVTLGDGGALAIGYDGTTAERWEAATATWRQSAPLNAPRRDFAMVPLHDGRVLVAGGLDTSDPNRWQSYSSAYVYDPTTPAGTWVKVGLLGTARVAPAAAVLPDGRVLVAGGAYKNGAPWGSNRGSGVELAAFTASLAQPGTAGGGRFDDVAPPDFGVALATAEIFDPSTGQWSPTGAMKFARAGATAATLSDGRVLIVGPSTSSAGSGSVQIDKRAYGTAEVYDPATGRFALVGSLPPIDWGPIAAVGIQVPGAPVAPNEIFAYSANGTLVALPGGDAFLVGNQLSEKHGVSVTRSFRYHGATGRWTQVGPTWASGRTTTGDGWVSTPGVDLSGAFDAVLPDGRVLVVGGTVSDPSGGAATTIARAYDPATGAWSPLPPMPAGRSGGSTAVLSDGSVLLVGGNDSSTGPVTAVRFVPSP